MDTNRTKGAYCQSCGRPVRSKEDMGITLDGDRSEDYCKYCYEHGEFTEPDITLEEMINKTTALMVEKMKLPGDMARGMAHGLLPKLKRWQ